MSDLEIMTANHYNHRDDFVSSDPDAKLSIIASGGLSIEGVVFSKSQLSNLRNLYGFVAGEDGLAQAGSDRNMGRFAKRDGLRLIGVLSKFCDSNEDPVKVLYRLLAANGYDIGCIDWAESE